MGSCSLAPLFKKKNDNKQKNYTKQLHPRWFPLCVLQCGTSFSRASLTGCGGSVWRSSTMQRRHHMRTPSWCSRLALSPCPPSHMYCAVWHPTHGNKSAFESLPSTRMFFCVCVHSWLTYFLFVYMFVCFLTLAEESSNCWWNFNWRIKIILHTQVNIDQVTKVLQNSTHHV